MAAPLYQPFNIIAFYVIEKWQEKSFEVKKISETVCYVVNHELAEFTDWWVGSNSMSSWVGIGVDLLETSCVCWYWLVLDGG